MIRYRIACTASMDTSIVLCKEQALRLWRCLQLTLTCCISCRCPGGGAQATCTISIVIDLQNLLGTPLVLRVVFILKTKQPPPSCLFHIQQKSQTSTLTLSLHCHWPCHQSCPTLLATTLTKARSSTFGCSELSWESKLREGGRSSQQQKQPSSSTPATD